MNYRIFSLYPQPGIRIRQRISPIIRTGTISVMNDDRTFYIDAAAFPGNSGSPVFLRPTLSYDGKGCILWAEAIS
jgi:V8-like Glu-specific endopeptidase